MEEFFKYLFRPKFWRINYKTCEKWDTLLNRLMRKYPITDINGHTCKINNIQIWIDNYPYFYGNPYKSGCSEMLPKINTVEKLHHLVEVAILEQELRR